MSAPAKPAYTPPSSVITLTPTAQLEALYTIIRNKDTPRGDFLFYSDRIIRLLVEEGLNHLPVVPKTVETPTVRVACATYLRVSCERGACQGRELTCGAAVFRARRTKASGSKARSAACLFCVLERCVPAHNRPTFFLSGMCHTGLARRWKRASVRYAGACGSGRS